MFRPLLPSDEFGYRNFFYSLQDKTIYFRFFYKMKTFSHEVAQKHWASVDYRKNMSIIGLVQRGGHKEIMSIGSYAEAEKGRAEIAFVVREDYQNLGIASYLIDQLESIAKENNYIGFTATVLKENEAMLHVFKKKYPKVKTKLANGSEVELLMNFIDHPREKSSGDDMKALNQ